MNKKFMEWTKGIGKKHKFFAYLHYNDLHAPYRPKPPYDTLYLGKIGSGYEGTTDLDRRKALYDGQLTYIDTQIGILLNNLKKEGLYDNTLIVITGDHGEGFGEHGIMEHSKPPYDILTRVPLIIKFPQSSYAGRSVNNQVRLIDVMPTILDFLQIKTDRKLSGFSLLNYLDNDKKDRVNYPKYAISELFNRLHFRENSLSIRTEEFKYIYFLNREDELYNLKTDPKEENNIIKLKPEIAERFREMLPPILSQSEKNRKRTLKVNYDKKMVEELKALGYIQ
jgi:arylsulfatase A-like enzyme